MRQMAEHQRNGIYGVSHSRPGFTLVESVAATAIMFILLIGLMGMFARGVAGFKNAQLLTFAENLSEFQAEDLKAMAPSVLNHLVEGHYPDPALGSTNPLVKYSNYPADTNAADYIYDSGWVQTDINVIGVSRIVQSPWVAGSGVMSEPPVPTNGDVLLGGNIVVVPYEDLDDAGNTLGWYYNVKLLHQAYPNFSKRIVVTQYDAASLPAKNVHTYNAATAMFDYTITVRQKVGTVYSVLYTTAGTVAYPYSNQTAQITVTNPNGGESLAAGSAETITWSVSGDASTIATYAVWMSTDGGLTYSSLGSVPATDHQLHATMPGVASTQCTVTVNALDAGGMLYIADSSDDLFTLH